MSWFSSKSHLATHQYYKKNINIKVILMKYLPYTNNSFEIIFKCTHHILVKVKLSILIPMSLKERKKHAKNYVIIIIFIIFSNLPFFQITSSAVRPLTKIPHCCTNNALGFFQTQCGRSTFQLRLRDFAAS